MPLTPDPYENGPGAAATASRAIGKPNLKEIPMSQSTARTLGDNTPISELTIVDLLRFAELRRARASEWLGVAEELGLDLSKVSVEDIIAAMIMADEAGRE